MRTPALRARSDSEQENKKEKHRKGACGEFATRGNFIRGVPPSIESCAARRVTQYAAFGGMRTPALRARSDSEQENKKEKHHKGACGEFATRGYFIRGVPLLIESHAARRVTQYAAFGGMRTPDTLIKSQVLYQLSYRGKDCEEYVLARTKSLFNTPKYNSTFSLFCQYF